MNFGGEIYIYIMPPVSFVLPCCTCAHRRKSWNTWTEMNTRTAKYLLIRHRPIQFNTREVYPAKRKLLRMYGEIFVIISFLWVLSQLHAAGLCNPKIFSQGLRAAFAGLVIQVRLLPEPDKQERLGRIWLHPRYRENICSSWRVHDHFILYHGQGPAKKGTSSKPSLSVYCSK